MKHLDIVISFLLFLSMSLVLQYPLSIPFEPRTTTTFINNIQIATNIFDMRAAPIQVGYPRLFHVLPYILYKTFNLTTLQVANLMYFIMFASLLFGMKILKELGGHPLTMFFVPFMISYGAYGRAIGTTILLFYIFRPSIWIFLALGFGYTLYLPLLIPFMIVKRHYKDLVIGSVILSPYLCYLVLKNLYTFNSAVDANYGLQFAFEHLHHHTFFSLLVYFIVLLPVTMRAIQAVVERRSYDDLLLPLSVVACGVSVLLIEIHPVFLFDYFSLLPIFDSIIIYNYRKGT